MRCSLANPLKQVPACVAYIFLERHTVTPSFLYMESSIQYRKFAEECRRYAQSAETDEQRKVLLEMGAAWAKLAEEADELEAKSRTN